MISNFFIPSTLFIIGGLITFFLKGFLRTIFSLLIPIVSFYFLLKFQNEVIQYNLLGNNLTLFLADKISLAFSYIFHIFSILALFYAGFSKNNIEIGSGLIYVGASLGVIFAGDLFTFYIFWELLTFGAVVFIFLGKEKDSQNASYRYLVYHIIGGLCLLAGILLQYKATGNIAFQKFNLDSLSSILIFLGVGLNAGFPLLHTWIVDSYPKASIVGAVFLSSLTTKVAIYALIRFFAGTEALIYIGTFMVIFPIFYAVIENDLRKVLSYSLINQLGFMIVGIGIGTELALNGTISHVVVHIIYKSLLFMTMGAVVYKYKTCKVTNLGGLYKTMPITTICCVIASLSIASFPLFSGFVTKSMIMASVANEHRLYIWITLLFGSAAVVKYFKAPFFAFFGKANEEYEDKNCNNEKREAPTCMLISMCLGALLCIIIGVFPNETIYKILPFSVSYEPYETFHVIGQLEILFFATLSLYICCVKKIYPEDVDKINLDVDVFYRKGFKAGYGFIEKSSKNINNYCFSFIKKIGEWASDFFDFLSSYFVEKKIPIGLSLVAFIILIFLLAF